METEYEQLDRLDREAEEKAAIERESGAGNKPVKEHTHHGARRGLQLNMRKNLPRSSRRSGRRNIKKSLAGTTSA